MPTDQEMLDLSKAVAQRKNAEDWIPLLIPSRNVLETNRVDNSTVADEPLRGGLVVGKGAVGVVSPIPHMDEWTAIFFADTFPIDPFGGSNAYLLSSDLNQTLNLISAINRRASLVRNFQGFLPSNRGYEEWYRRLEGDPGTRAKVLRKWLESGEQGAAWLVARLASENRLAARERTCETLVRMGEVAIPYIIMKLGEASKSEDTELTTALLYTLRSFERNALLSQRNVLAPLLRTFAGKTNKYLREAAYYCLVECLPPEEAKKALSDARKAETDPELIEVLQELEGECSNS
jgi:hypothetical protein